ncbi:GAF domain-containing protein [Mycolicibacterium sarraceniae]|nr:GAF domain-containing protein [Mycolicibacterium sarraceniae]
MNDTVPQPAGSAGHGPRRGVDRATGRHVIARLAGPDHDHTVRAVVDQLSGEQSAVDAIVDDAVSDPERLESLERLGRFDETRNPTLDRVAVLVAEALGTPMAAVSVVYPDRQVLAGSNTSDEAMPRVAPLAMSICKFTVASREALVVDGTGAHPMLWDHPAVVSGAVLADAGVPLIDSKEYVAGTLCTWDTRPRHWSSAQIQIQILNDLADPHGA